MKKFSEFSDFFWLKVMYPIVVIGLSVVWILVAYNLLFHGNDRVLIPVIDPECAVSCGDAIDIRR